MLDGEQGQLTAVVAYAAAPLDSSAVQQLRLPSLEVNALEATLQGS